MISKTINGLNKFNVNIDSFTQQEELFLDGINIYTDGSKGPYGSGSSFIIYDTPENIIAKQSIALGPCPMVFQNEVYAIDRASKTIRNMILNGSVSTTKVNILSDSQAALTSN